MNHPEEWRALEWAPNYEFSSLGRVRRTSDAPGTFAGRILSQSLANGYRQLNLSLSGKATTRKVHRLICEAFHGPAPSVLHQAAHADGDRTNNREGNLRWALPTENSADDLRNGVRPMGESHPLAKLTEGDVASIRREHAEWIEAIAGCYGVGVSTVRGIIAGSRWKHSHAQPPATNAL